MLPKAWRWLVLPAVAAAASQASESARCEDGQVCTPEDTVLLQRKGSVLGGSSRAHEATRGAKFPLDSFAGKSIYFLLVDRFARTDNITGTCGGTEETNNAWCGGTLKGITEHLDYIAGMGFDCVWLTPIVEQYPLKTSSGTGAMGYWAYDIYKIDKHFGTPEDYHELIEEAHKKGLCIVQDFVANHMGPVHGAKDVEKMNPFNKTDYFHQLFIDNLTFDEYTAEKSSWPPPAQAMWSQSGAQCTKGMDCNCYTDITGEVKSFSQKVHKTDGPCPPNFLSEFCRPGDYACQGYNETITQQGWFYDLGDLNQTNPFVREKQLEWIKWYTQTYKIDAWRLDTAAFMTFDFLSELQEAAKIPIIGEVTATNLTYHAQFEANPPPSGRPVLDGVLNFPTHFTAAAAFCGTWFPFSQGNLGFLGKRMMDQLNEGVYKSVDTLGNFADNHDGERASKVCAGDPSKIANFIAWVMLTKGAPIIYYGTELYFKDQRKDFWTSGYRTDTYMYRFIQTLNGLRKTEEITVADMEVKSSTHTSTHLVFTRGDVWIFLNNLFTANETTSYCHVDLPPKPKKHHAWVNVLADEGTNNLAVLEDDCLMAPDTYPLVLVQRKTKNKKMGKKRRKHVKK